MYEYHGNKGSRRQQEIKKPLTLYRAGGFLFISCRRYQTDHLQIYSGGVRILNVQLEQDGKEIKLPADTVIIAAGLAPKLDEAESFRSCAPEFWKIGDCRQARNVRLAIHEGYDAGSYIE